MDLTPDLPPGPWDELGSSPAKGPTAGVSPGPSIAPGPGQDTTEPPSTHLADLWAELGRMVAPSGSRAEVTVTSPSQPLDYPTLATPSATDHSSFIPPSQVCFMLFVESLPYVFLTWSLYFIDGVFIYLAGGVIFFNS